MECPTEILLVLTIYLMAVFRSTKYHGKRMILCLCVAEKNGYIIY